MSARAAMGGVLAAVATLGVVPAAHADPSAVTRSIEQSPAEVRAYWTKARMAAARPLDPALPRPTVLPGLADLRDHHPRAAPFSVPTAEPAPRAAVTVTDTRALGTRTHGKIFGSDVNGDYVCSGTVVNAPNGSTLWTAGHCLFDHEQGGGFATNIAFVPGYNQGARPFGTWAARRIAVPPGWHLFEDSRDDVGAARMQVKTRPRRRSEKRRCGRLEGARKRRCKRRNRRPVRVPIQDKVGARGIAFNLDPGDFTYRARGYPEDPEPRFDGEHMELCVSPLKARDSGAGNPAPIGIDCDMGGGSSGGGFVISRGRVNGNVSYSLLLDPNTVYSPYFDSVTRTFYNAVKDD